MTNFVFMRQTGKFSDWPVQEGMNVETKTERNEALQDYLPNAEYGCKNWEIQLLMSEAFDRNR